MNAHHHQIVETARIRDQAVRSYALVTLLSRLVLALLFTGAYFIIKCLS